MNLFLWVLEDTNEDELRCIASDADQRHIFQYPTFDKFISELVTIETVLDNSRYTCVNHPTVGLTLLDDEPEDCKNFESTSLTTVVAAANTTDCLASLRNNNNNKCCSFYYNDNNN